MKRLGGIWPKLVSFENLLLAYRKARRGKRSRPGVAEFGLDLERQLIAIQSDLENGEYQPGGYRLFTIYDRKPRVIAAAPFRDRVVHHAVMNLVEPAPPSGIKFDVRFNDDDMIRDDANLLTSTPDILRRCIKFPYVELFRVGRREIAGFC